jgi:uncharacterized protein YndB with AHSA1/START domain
MTASPLSFEVRARSRASAEAVWSVIADARAWSEWAGLVTRSSLEREGQPEPDGVGAVRRLGTGAFDSREEVVEFDPPKHLAYVLLSGMPVRHYRADVYLEGGPGGTDISWRSSFEARYPGTGKALVWFMSWMVGQFARRAARRAEELERPA